MREPVRGSHGMVAAGHSLAATAALETLRSGGNAVDALLAASGVQCVVEMPWSGLGGDAFLLIYTPDAGVVALNGSGIVPRSLDLAQFPNRKAPRFGPLSVAVPGLVQAWERAASRFASRPLRQLIHPAIHYAREGFPVYPRMQRAIQKLEGQGDVSPALGTLLENNGRQVGERFRQPDLGETLAGVADGGAEWFYGDGFGRGLASCVAQRGGALSAHDLSSHSTDWIAPVSVPYRDWQVYSQPPVSMGCVLLQELRILEGFKPGELEPGSPRLMDLLVRCKKAAFSDAQTYLGDPDERDVPVDWLLSDERTAYWQERLGAPAARVPVLTDGISGSDTTCTVVMDQSGMVACLIQSLFNEFGSRELIPGTGVLMNDRLANMVVDDQLPNGLHPGQRPLHTLNTYMVFANGHPLLAGATPGGKGQVQTNLQVLVNVLDSGMDIQAAVDAPRWISGLPYKGENDETLYLEPAFPDATVTALEQMGHTVMRVPPEQTEPFGNCTLVARAGGTGSLEGAGDARRGACAIGW